MSRLLPIALFAACGVTPTPATTTLENVASEDRGQLSHDRGQLRHDLYVGRAVGIQITHVAHGPNSRQSLPEGLEMVSAVNVADGWHWTIARAKDDLAILLIDDRGIVADDVTMTGRGDHQVIVGNCPNGFVGVAAKNGCAGVEQVSVDIAWDRDDRSLVKREAQTCSCALINLD